jgi:hypothetical protein
VSKVAQSADLGMFERKGRKHTTTTPHHHTYHIPRQSCPAVAWRRIGPSGPKGPNGLKGPDIPKGPNRPKGLNRPKGPNRSKGPNRPKEPKVPMGLNDLKLLEVYYRVHTLD